MFGPFKKSHFTNEVEFVGTNARGVLCGFWLYENRQVFGRYVSLGRKTLMVESFTVPDGTSPRQALDIAKDRFLPGRVVV